MVSSDQTRPNRRDTPLPIALLKQLAAICAFRARPQDLPTSAYVVIFAAVLSALSNVLVASSLLKAGEGNVLSLAIGQVVIFSVVVWLILRIKARPERWPQTVSALLGTGALFQLLLMPLLNWHSRMTESYDSFVLAPTIPMLLSGIVGAWSIAVATYIMRNALEVRIPAALLVTVGSFFVSQLILEIIVHPGS